MLEQLVADLSPKNKLNLLIYDGEILYVHTNYKDSLFFREENGSIYFATIPLKHGEWTRVPFMKLISYRDGKILRTGRCHGNEYIPDACSINALYLAYSGL